MRPIVGAGGPRPSLYFSVTVMNQRNRHRKESAIALARKIATRLWKSTACQAWDQLGSLSRTRPMPRWVSESFNGGSASKANGARRAGNPTLSGNASNSAIPLTPHRGGLARVSARSISFTHAYPAETGLRAIASCNSNFAAIDSQDCQLLISLRKRSRVAYKSTR
jgi:hypothetical protein